MNAIVLIGLGNAVLATVLALVAAVISRCRPGPALVHGLWLLVLLKLVTPPLVPIPLPGWSGPAAPADRAGTSGPGERGVSTPWERPESPESQFLPGIETPRASVPSLPAAEPRPWIVGVVWLAGSLLWFALAVRRVQRFNHLLRNAIPAPESLQAEARQVGQRLGLRRVPPVWLVHGKVSPLLWAFGGRARVLLPSELLAHLGPEQRQALLAHELAHYRRRDHWVRGLELLATGLFWWHPITWWARARLREAEEQCCDAWVVWALPEIARAYAEALLATLDFLSGARPMLPAEASTAGHFSLLRRRFLMIAHPCPSRSLTAFGRLALAVLALAVLPWLPSLAQEVGPASPTDKAVEKKADGKPEPAPASKVLKVKFRQITDALDWLAGGQNAADSRPIASEKASGPEPTLTILAAQREVRISAVMEAEAEVRKARRRVEKDKQLFERSAIPQEELDNATDDLSIQEARLKTRIAEVNEVEARLMAAKAYGPAEDTAKPNRFSAHRLDSALLEAAVAARQADVEEAMKTRDEAEKRLDKTRAMCEKGCMSLKEVDGAETTLKRWIARVASAKAELKLAELRLAASKNPAIDGIDLQEIRGRLKELEAILQRLEKEPAPPRPPAPPVKDGPAPSSPSGIR